MNSEAKDIDALNEEMAKIDKAVFQLSVDVRMGIKGMFSKEQMAQHIKDSAAWQKQNAEKIAKEKAAAAKAIEEAKKKQADFDDFDNREKVWALKNDLTSFDFR